MIKDFDFYYALLIFIVNMRESRVASLKDLTITNAFQKILNDSERKPSKIWVDKGNEFYSRSMKSWYKIMI